MNTIGSMERLIYYFSKLPGVGRKTAERYAYKVLDMTLDDVKDFASSLIDTKENVKFCTKCGNFTENDICDICKTRNSDVICVVKEPKDIVAIEKSKNANYLYHVLHGTISPMENRGPNDIHIKESLGRLDGIKEVIIATNSNIEGETTAMYISRLIKPTGVKITRIASGVPVGGELEYIDEVTLSRALDARVEL